MEFASPQRQPEDTTCQERPREQHRLAAIRELAAKAEAVEDRVSEYGVFLRAEGALTGPNGRTLAVVTIWLESRADGRTRFVTLKPRKEKKS
jgi:hypothetical protein